MYRLVSIWEAQKYNALHVRQLSAADYLSAVAIGRGPRRCLFECLKNILLDFKNGHNRFITRCVRRPALPRVVRVRPTRRAVMLCRYCQLVSVC